MSSCIAPGVSQCRSAVRRWLISIAIAGASVLPAQQIALNHAPPAPGSAESDSSLASVVLPGAGSMSGLEAATFGATPAIADVQAGLGESVVPALTRGWSSSATGNTASWNRSLLEAFERGVHTGRSSTPESQTVAPDAPLLTRTELRLAQGAGSLFPQAARALAQPGFDRLVNAGVNLGLISPAQAARVSYRDLLSSWVSAPGRPRIKTHGTSTPFYYDHSLMNFCAALAGGPAKGRASGGLSIDSVSPGHAQHHTGPSVALRLTF